MSDAIISVEEANSDIQMLVRSIKNHRMSFLDLGIRLKKIRDYDEYKKASWGNDWKEFLSNPEINIKPATADVYIRVYEFYIEKMGLSPEEVAKVPIFRLNQLRSKVESLPESDQKELVSQMATLRWGDLNKVLEDKGMYKRPWIVITKCMNCHKYEITYEPEAMCVCQGIPSIAPRPIIDIGEKSTQ